jgi:signal peptidase I
MSDPLDPVDPDHLADQTPLPLLGGPSAGTTLVRVLKGWVAPIVVAAAIMFPLRAALADWYQVPTGSMRPTIIEGDRIFVSNLAYGLRIPFTTTWVARWHEPQRGDIVTLASPADGERLVKRVIGLPGDRISMDGDHLCINGAPVSYEVKRAGVSEKVNGQFEAAAMILTEDLPGGRSHSVTVIPSVGSRRTFADLIVPQGSFFVMGDNRDQSYDSRYFGFVRQDKIYGRASSIVMSFDPGHYYLPRAGRLLKPLV